MIRSVKGVDWSKTLAQEDLTYLVQKIAHDEWYPMATFERLGNAILREVAGDDLTAVRMWGRSSVAALCAANPLLVAKGNPVESLMRFRVLRSTYFDFEALDIPMLIEDHAHVVIRYHMGTTAEEAASYQTMGFFEGLLDAAGAGDVRARFEERCWAGDARTLLELLWSGGG